MAGADALVEAFEAARTSAFTKDEWDDYLRAGMAIQNERGLLSLAKKEGLDEGRKQGLRQSNNEPWVVNQNVNLPLNGAILRYDRTTGAF